MNKNGEPEYRIVKKGELYVVKFYAGNGQLLFTSTTVDSKSSAKNIILVIKKYSYTDNIINNLD